jgi:hypothetical protein
MTKLKRTKASHMTDVAPLPAPRFKPNRLVDPKTAHHSVIIYAAGSRGLINFARPLGVPIFKVGVTSSQTPQRRVEDLRRKGYASLWGPAGQAIHDFVSIPQAHEWCLSPFREKDLVAPLPPGFSIVDGHLEVRVPFSVTVEAVDRAVHVLLKNRSLERFLASAEGQMRLAQAGLDPQGQLHTRYTLMTRRDRISRAEEIYLFRPQADLATLVRGLSQALAPLMMAGRETA